MFKMLDYASFAADMAPQKQSHVMYSGFCAKLIEQEIDELLTKYL